MHFKTFMLVFLLEASGNKLWAKMGEIKFNLPNKYYFLVTTENCFCFTDTCNDSDLVPKVRLGRFCTFWHFTSFLQKVILF